MARITEYLEISVQLGNAAMETPADVAFALRGLAERIEREDPARGKILDLNGNTVGWFGKRGIEE